jgi:CBS domain containing-hemolysin-like protein
MGAGGPVDIFVLSLVLVLLLALNAFYVLAEFAIVKVRPSRVAELEDQGDARARALADIQKHMDEYLGVCQLGITFASVALGMVGTKLTEAILHHPDHSLWTYTLAIAISYLLVSGAHIVLGEQVPKSAAIRIADRAALRCAKPLRISRAVFFPVLWLLTVAARGVLRLLGLSSSAAGSQPSEGELRLILEKSQERGLMSFRRLLFMENVFDFGRLTARDAMRARSSVRTLDARQSWAQNLAVIRATRFTRYPLVTGDGDKPIGFVHLKDLIIRATDGDPELRRLVRPMLTTTEATPLEGLLAEMQRRRLHLALVTGAEGRWTGFITLEDVIEELVGTIRDEFEDEEPARLSDSLAADRIHLAVVGDSPIAALRAALATMPPESLPMPAEQIVKAIEEREHLVSTYLGDGVGMPHARVNGLQKPFMLVLRIPEGVPCVGTTEKGKLLFVLLTPAGQPRVHQQLQSVIVTLLNESEFVKERLLTATTQAEVLDVLRTAEQAVLD